MASAIDNARRRLAELEKEIEEIQKFIELHERYLKLSTDSDAADDNEIVSSDISQKQRKSRKTRMPTTNLVDMIERIIREANHPLTRGELVEMLEARDVELPAADKPRYVGTIMWRNKSKFINIEGHGYWLRGMPWPNLLNQISGIVESIHKTIGKSANVRNVESVPADLPKSVEWDRPVELSEEARKSFERQNK